MPHPPPPGRELPNDPDDNPCFACGPKHPFGLRLRFFDDGEWVRASLTLDDRYCGWPGELFDGILYSALGDTIYWASWARFGQLAKSDGRPEIVFAEDPKTNVPFTVEARLVKREGEWTTFEAVCRQEGRLCARMTRRLRPATANDARELLAKYELPRTIKEEFEGIAKTP